MGAAISQLWTPPMIDIGVVGLPSAGKTAIIHKLSGGQKPTEPLNQSMPYLRLLGPLDMLTLE